MKFLIAGLGNIGAEYVETRHNIGFDIVSVLANKHRGEWRTDRLADVCNISIKGKKLVLIKPSTYMNLSGRAIKYWLDTEKIPIEHLLVVVDDLAFPLDAIKMKKNGSDAGHNGLKNIQEVLGTQQYPRLRFGIGNQFAKGKQVDFVLGRWLDSEMPLVNKKINVACEMIECFCTIGIDRTMNLYNNTPVKP